MIGHSFPCHIWCGWWSQDARRKPRIEEARRQVFLHDCCDLSSSKRDVWNARENHHGQLSRAKKSVVAERFPELTLCYGGELYYTKDIIGKLDAKKLPTLNGTKQVLVEFSMNTLLEGDPRGSQWNHIVRINSVIAHIERYDALAFKGERVAELIDKGCFTSGE